MSDAGDLGPAGRAYRGARERIAALVTADGADVSARVPCCPEWTVTEVVAHVTGVVDDVLAGNLDGVGTDPWTAAQVEARRGRPVADMVAGWNDAAPAFEAVLDAFGRAGWQAVFDTTTHEHDLRAALGQPGARDSDGVLGGLDFAVPAMLEAAAADGRPVPRITTTDGRSWGDESAPAVLRTDPFELIRTLSGRRSEAQIRAMGWEGDVDAVLPALAFGPFRPSTTDVEE